MPQRLDTVENWINHEFGEIEEKLERNIDRIQDTQTLLHRNQLEFSQNLISHVEMVQKIGEAAMSVKQAADTVKDMTEALYDVMRNVTRPLWDQSITMREMEVDCAGNGFGREIGSSRPLNSLWFMLQILIRLLQAS